MTGQIETRIEKPYGQTREAQAAAIARISREPQAELLLMMLGLVADPGPAVVEGQPCCPSCRRPYRRDGRTSCRWRDCDRGPASRGGAR